MSEKVQAFFKNFGGFVIGSIVGIIVILCGIIDMIEAILVVLLFGWLGTYIQRNKAKVKEMLKNLIEKW